MFRKVLYCIKGCSRYVLKLLNQSWGFLFHWWWEKLVPSGLELAGHAIYLREFLYEDSVMEGTRIVPLRSLTALVN